MSDHPLVIQRMQALVDRWQEAADRRAVFLHCYMLMTGNMLVAIERDEFHDRAWVSRLLHRFADYYFEALEVYEAERTAAPPVWQVTHDAAREPGARALQTLFLGVNAHINYDLVLTVADLLQPEWSQLSEAERQRRFADHCHVNRVIGRTVDSVQDDVVERAEPALDIVDKALGPLDEWLTARLITRWRDEVWHNAVRYVECRKPRQRERLRREVETLTLRRADAILLKEGPATLGRLL